MISQAGSFGYDYNNAEDLVERLSLPGGSAVTNDYDGVGRLLETVLRSSGGTLRNAHGYELNDGHQRTQQTFTEGNYVDYTYDDIGQLETAKGKESGGASRLNEQFGYAYDAAWNLNRRTNNALVQSFSVNSRNELTWPEDHYILPGQPPIHSGSKVWTHMDEQGTNGPVVSSILPPRVERRSHASQWDNPAVLFLEHCAVGASGPRFGGEQTYVRNAQAGLTLVTGGKASVQRRNLFQMQVEVAQLTNPQYRYLEDDPSPEQEVDGWKVILGELGPVGSDGRVWKGLPDNAEFDVTPKVTPALSPDFYWFTVTPTRHKLSIETNGVELEPDKVVTNAEFCVGQKIVFTPSLVPAFSQQVQSTVANWTFEGTFVNDHTNAVPGGSHPESSEVYYMNWMFLTNITATNWWVSGEFSPPATYSARLGLNVEFNNGQQAVLVEKGLLHMHRPRLVDLVREHPSWIVNQLFIQHKHTALGEPGIHSEQDLLWAPAYYKISVESTFGGEAAITQLINGWATNECPFAFTTGDDYLLDTKEFVSTNDVTAFSPEESTLDFFDGQHLECVGNTAEQLDFRDYIRFQPAGGIYITLGTVQWNVNPQTYYDPYASPLGDYVPAQLSATQNPLNLPLPTSQGIFHLDSSTTESEQFPIWKAVATGTALTNCPGWTNP